MTRRERIDARLRECAVDGVVPHGTGTWLAEELGVSRQYISQRRQAVGLTTGPRQRPVMDRIVAELRDRFPDGTFPYGSLRELAGELGVYESQVWVASSELGLTLAMPAHGTTARYKRGCHCDECRAGHNARNTAMRKARRPEDAPVHGHHSSYSNWNCRCEPCTKANTEYSRRYVRAYHERQRAKRQGVS